MQVKEITSKSCLTSSALTDYVINPYVGCTHACRYCYAVFMKRFYDIQDPWGEFVHIKANSPALLARELERHKPGNIWMSSVTDPYQPPEAKYQITRKILEVMRASPSFSKYTLEILTKSALVQRDFELLLALKAELGLSINSLDSNVSRLIEPRAALPAKRIAVLRAGKQAGLKVFGFISPVIPGVTQLEDLFRELSFCDYAWVELLNVKDSVMRRLWPLLKSHFKHACAEVETYVANPAQYYDRIRAEVAALQIKHGLVIREVVRHDLKQVQGSA